MEWLVGGGQAGALVRSTDWSSTPWGPRERWPAALRAAVNLVLGSPSPVALLWGPELRLLYNDAFREAASLDHPEALGRTLAEVWPSPGRGDGAALAAALGGGESVALRLACGGDGLTLRCTPLRDEDGAVAGALVAAEERAQPQRALDVQEDSAALLRVISDASGDVIFAKDRDGRLCFANAAALALIGRPLEAVLGHTDAELLADPEAARQVMESDRRIMEAGRPTEVEESVPQPDGSRRVWLSRKTPYRDARGRVVGLLGISRDITQRKQSEAQLERLSQQRQLALDAARLGWWHYDPQTRLASYDRRYTEIFGVEGAEKPNDEILALLHPEDLPRVWAAVEVALDPRDPRPYAAEYRITRPDGQVRWIEAHGQAVFEGEGPSRRAVSLVGTVQDVTDRKHGEQQLRRERDFTSAVVDVAGALVIVLDREGRILRFNRACETTSGYSADELLGRRYQLLEAPEDRAASSAGWAAAVRGESLRVQREWVTKGGERRLIAWSNAILRGPDGKVEFVVGTGLDITERTRAERALRQSEAKLRAVFRALVEGVVFVNASGEIEDVNAAIVGAHDPHLLGLIGPEADPGPRALRPDGTPFPLDELPVAVALATGEAVRDVEMGLPAQDGTVRWRLVNAQPVRDDAGALLGAVASFIDITDRKRSEAALKEANARLVGADHNKTEFLAILSHELRNPLAPIRNSIYILEHAAPGGPQARRALSVVDRQVAHMTRLIEDLLDVTRISRGKIRLQREPSLLNDLVRAAGEDHRDLLSRGGVALEVRVPEEPLRASVDRTRIGQIVGNLLQNAAKFSEPGGRVRLSLSRGEADRAIVRVRDDGAGIEPALLARLFEPFVQADATLDRTKGGLGLGLALVKGLVELHGGTVTAHSDGAGRGAEFTVRLPLEQPEARARGLERGGEGRADGRRALRVLVIEDNEDAAETLKDALELGGHEVALAGTGLEGLSRARAFGPDVVLCDLGLPGIDGYEVARRMRADPALRTPPLVALSGYAAPDDLARSREAGFVRHLAKPPDLGALERTLLEVSAAQG